MKFVENFFPNCSEKKLRNKISIPEPCHPNTEDDNTNPNHPTDDLDNPPHDPPVQPDEDEEQDNDDQGDTTKPQSPTQHSPKQEETSNEGVQAPQGEPHFNIGHAPTPQREYVPPPYNLPREHHYPTRIQIPWIIPDNVYGNKNPVDIEREIAQEREWTRRVLQGEPTIEQDHPMPAAEEPLLPLTPLTPEPTNDIEDLYEP